MTFLTGSKVRIRMYNLAPLLRRRRPARRLSCTYARISRNVECIVESCVGGAVRRGVPSVQIELITAAEKNGRGKKGFRERSLEELTSFRRFSAYRFVRSADVSRIRIISISGQRAHSNEALRNRITFEANQRVSQTSRLIANCTQQKRKPSRSGRVAGSGGERFGLCSIQNEILYIHLRS